MKGVGGEEERMREKDLLARFVNPNFVGANDCLNIFLKYLLTLAAWMLQDKIRQHWSCLNFFCIH